MKKYIIECAIVSVLVVGGVLWFDDENQKTQDSAIPQSQNIPANVPIEHSQRKTLLESMARERTLPIEFQGKIIDQYNDPVKNAQLEFSVSYPDIKVFDTRFRKIRMQSNERGEFRISGMKGSGLIIDSIKKDGYVLTPNFFNINSYSYYNSDPKSQYKFNPNSPVIIRMWKKNKSEELVKFDEHTRIPYDGTSVYFDLINRNKGFSGGDLKVTLIRDPLKVIWGQRNYYWKMVIEAVDGGVIPANDEFMYLAPATGYQPSITIEMKADDPQWISRKNISFYLKSRNGQCYASVVLEFFTDSDRSNTGCSIISYLNSAGSRNLER